MNEPWRQFAACKSQTHLFFPAEDKKTVRYTEALELCGSCSVIDDCLKYAVRYEMVHGIWGGTTPNQRRVLIHEGMRRTA